MHACGYMNMSADACREARGIRTPGAGIIGSWEPPIWVLQTELGSSARGVYTFNHWASFQPPGDPFYEINILKIIFKKFLV